MNKDVIKRIRYFSEGENALKKSIFFQDVFLNEITYFIIRDSIFLVPFAITNFLP
jgi:hypothetical protein